MARVKVPQADGELVVFDGAKSHVYTVKDGALVVSADHLAAVLASVSGSELVVEAPPKEK